MSVLCLQDYKVILMDATVATGAAAIMAIRVLLDHEVPESSILLASLLMAEIGVHSVAYAFPKVIIMVKGLEKWLRRREPVCYRLLCGKSFKFKRKNNFRI